jgi:hypothetical protein
MTFFETLVTPPITLVPGDGQYRLQPLYVDDLVRAIVRAVEDPELRDVVLDVGGAEPITFDRLLDTLAHRVGKDRARKIHVPWGTMQVVANLTDRLRFGPISSDELSMLRRGNWADIQPFVDRLGFTPLPFDTGLARKPRNTADRWYSWLRPLKLPLRLSIAFVWLATGIISATVSADRGIDLLAQIGITGALANVALFGTSGLEIVIGTATAIGWRVRLMGTIQLFLIFGFTLILTVGLPHLWLDPFGPLTKNIPLIGATLAMMAVEE